MSHPLTLARWLLAFLAIVNVYRAATQSITTDEAFTFTRSVSAPIPRLWDSFDANDHVLHTLLCKASTNLFGVSEFTLRLPSLLGGFLYLWVALALSRYGFGEGWRMLLSVSLLALNPLMLDYCSVARGYGMASAMFLTAFWLLLPETWGAAASRWRLMLAGLLMALSVAANLTALVPCAALLLTFTLLWLLPAARDGAWSRVRHRANRVVDYMVVPFLVVAFAILWVPLLPAKRTDFYVGATSVTASLLSFGQALFWRPDPQYFGTSWQNSVKPLLARLMAYGVFPSLLLASFSLASVVGLRWLRQKDNPRREDQLLMLGGLVLLGCVAASAIGNMAWNVPYPYRRTGLYLVPLVTLVSVAALSRIRWAGLALAALVLANFAAGFNFRYYDEWIFDAGTKEIMRRAAEFRPVNGAKLRLATSAYLEHAARFYARRYGYDWIEVPAIPPDTLASGDLYLLTLGDRRFVDQRGLTIAYEHPVSMVVLAQSTTESQPRRDKSQ